METFCATNGGVNSKFRPNLTSNFYHNVPCPRNMRQIGNDYAMPSCNNRRSTQSIHTLWQERTSPRSDHKSSRGKLCSVALAIASFVVLIAVLSIAGMALYMGALHSEHPSSNKNLLSYSCSAKISRGDRLIGNIQEKLRRYKLQFEALYQRSVLGPALVACTIERFGNDTATVFFKLTLNRKKLSRNVISVEKTIADILITDAISRKPVFRTVRFDPKSIEIKQLTENDLYQRNVASKPKEAAKPTKHGILKSPFRQNSNYTTNLSVKKKSNDQDAKKEGLPVVQGSFKISKTDADITEKKTETTTMKFKIEKTTTSTALPKKPTMKETSVTSALYKIAAIEKVNKNEVASSMPPSISSSTTSSTTASTTTSTTTTTTTSTTTTPVTSTKSTGTSPLFIINPHLFNEEPWIPILPNMESVTKPPIAIDLNKITTRDAGTATSATTTSSPIVKLNNKQPVYTSFTNPGLSYHSPDTETLGLSNVRSHPIPVNKIPTATEPIDDSTDDPEKDPFVEIETVKYVPGSTVPNDTFKLKQEQILKNLSSIFHNLASTLDASNVSVSGEEDMTLGQGQVEVVEGDEETLMMQTTKAPLVTLIPVKSNSGIGRPLRKRPFRHDLSVENRSFPGPTRLNDFSFPSKFIETEVVTSISSETKKVKTDKNHLEDFKIVGMLNFATENPEGLRNSKMDQGSEMAVYVTNSSVTTNEKIFNILDAEKLKQLSAISNIHDNLTSGSEPIISDKAVSSSYTVNHAGFKILTKTFNKISDMSKGDSKSFSNMAFATFSNDRIECANFTIRCGDGQCLPETTKCNQLIDCNDGKDEQDCNCADYLRSQYLLRKICDGVVDCWDYSDENQCDWCKPNQYVCGNSKVCIDRSKICDSVRDCPQGDDERQCVTIAPSLKAADEFPYFAEGYLMVRKYGEWGKFCVENFQNVVSRSQISWEVSDLGKAVCRSMTYQQMDSITNVIETDVDTGPSRYFELAYSFQNKTKSNLSFTDTKCEDKKVVKVKCQSLECGARPQAGKHMARIVGGGNARLGAWPWQAALYKEGEFQCGATLLSDRWLLSAGHCFFHSQEEHWVARLGALRRGTTLPSPYEQLRPIVKIIVHPGYVDTGFINDISLLKMEFPVVFSDYVRPVCLPQVDQPAIDGRLCTVVGWGQLFEIADTLQEVQVPVISTAECRKRTIFLPLYKITDDMFCAGYERGGRDACLGDSGGPLMCPEPNGRWVLQGITSNGYGCARANRPGVYTKVANYITWISKHLAEDNNETTKSSKSVCLGHRCPLGECLPKSRLCNGYIECSDGSDERDC